MLKAGLYALTFLGLFAVVFALLPVERVGEAQTGATLSGVALSLYPSRDPQAVWRFRAASVTNDPLKGETRLTGLSDGGRWITPANQPGAPRVLDATLSTPDLTIDAQDNLLTRQARITLVNECADIQLTGTPEQPVRVEQGVGFSAPVAQVDSPGIKGQVLALRMRFDFYVEESSPQSTLGWDPESTETCVNGKRVSQPPAP